MTFRGPIGELPQGGDGSYGTSITIHKAMVDTNDVIIAYKQNGRCVHIQQSDASNCAVHIDRTKLSHILRSVDVDFGCAIRRTLTPDHGFPCRMIIPGHIGGRMVKYLEVNTSPPSAPMQASHKHVNVSLGVAKCVATSPSHHLCIVNN